MKRLPSLAVVAVTALLATTAAGCDATPNAATVNGEGISQSSLNSTLSDLAASSPAQCALQLEYATTGQAPSRITGAGQGTVTQEAAGFVLTNLVLSQVIHQDLARRGDRVSASDVAAAKADLTAQLSQTESEYQSSNAPLPASCSAVTSNPLDHLSPRLSDAIIGSLAAQEVLGARISHTDISTGGLEHFYSQHPSDFRQVCLAVVFATSQAAAQAIHDKIAAGQSFTAAAADAGVDTNVTQNGQTVCLVPGQVISAFGQQPASTIYAAAVGTLLAPVAYTGSGSTDYLVMKVVGHQEVPFSQEEVNIRETLLSSASTATERELKRAVATAHVWVNPQYGSWDPHRATPSVVPPPAPPARDQLNAAANLASLNG